MGDPTTAVRVLHVDDTPDLADVVASHLERVEDRISVQTATSVAEGLAVLDAADVDCVVSDHDMPEMTGIEFLRRVREERPDLPFILYTGKGSEEVASEAISAGVTDYLQKESGRSHYAVLANRITNAVEQYRASRALATSQERLSLFFEESPLGVVEWTESFEVARVNEAATEILGYDEAALLGASWEAIVPDAAADQVGDVVDDLMAGAGGFHSVNENVRGDGEEIICEWHNRVVTDDDGDVVTIFSQFQDVTGRRTQQAELERQREVIQAARNAIVTTDGSGVVESANPAVEETFGYAPGAVVGEPITLLMHEETADRHRAAFERYLRTGERTRDWEDVEFVARHRDGSPIPVTVTFGTVADGDERRFVGIIRDVSERKAREQRRREKERRYQAVFGDPNVLFGLLDPEGRVVEANETALAYVDAPMEAVRGTPFQDAPWFDGAPSVRDDVADSVSRAASGEYVAFEADLARPDGEPYSVDGVFRPVTDDAGAVVSLLVSARDVTAQRTYEARLEALNDLARRVMSVDSRERVADLGADAARDLLDLGANAERGEARAVDDVHEDPDVYDPESPMRSELFLPLGDHGILIAGSTTPAAFDEEDVVLGEILAGTLVTALDEIERTEQLRGRERELRRQNERLEKFASVVSHDLRNPLTVAEGHLELARAECDSESLEGVARAHERMDTLIDDVLTLAREGNQVNDVGTVDLAETVESCWATVATGDANLVLEAEGTVRADPSRLQRLLENLVRNAVEHGGADVCITVGDLADGFYVADDGPGIPAAERDRAFDVGHSTSADGTGFGLSIVQEIAEAHGWSVHVVDGAEGGARIEVTGVTRRDR
jgi:PAS domain S-box-containing protein